MNRRPWLATAALAATGVLGLAGCGSSSTPSQSTAASSAASSNGSEASSAASSVSSGGGSSFCAQATSVITQLRQLGSNLAPAGTTPDQELARLKQLMAADASAFDSLASSVPSEIAADFETLRAAFNQANSNIQSATTIQQLEVAVAPLSTPAVKTASDHLSTYGKTVCGLTSTPTP